MNNYINEVFLRIPMSSSEQSSMRPALETAYKLRVPLYQAVEGLASLMQKARRAK